MKRHHPDHIRCAASRAGRPIYLDTTKPENVPYYESQGYRQIGGRAR